MKPELQEKTEDATAFGAAGLLDKLVNILEAARFATTFCDHPNDRMWHAADNTWWKRVGNRWEYAEPPPGWACSSSDKLTDGGPKTL